MLKLTSLLISLVCSICLGLFPGFACASETYFVSPSASGGILNMRDGPGAHHRLIVAIPANAGGLRIFACRAADDGLSRFSWCRANWNSRKGWVSSCCILKASQSQSTGPRYPFVFTSVSQLKRLGIALDLGTDKSIHFHTRCYYYGDGGWDISISSKFLAFYEKKGFSQASLCLALVSGIRFNPKTGARLATYILINDRAALAAGSVDSGVVSDELPLSIPECFKNGLPYSDCAWHFDPLTGRRLSESATAAYSRLGKQLEKRLASHREVGFCSSHEVDPETDEYRDTADNEFIKGELCRTGEGLYEGKGRSEATFYSYANNFPGGFGYALYADGGAGPSASPALVRAALDGANKTPQVDPEELNKIWSAGSDD